MRRIFYQTHIFSKKLDSRGGPALLLRIEEEILKNPDSGFEPVELHRAKNNNPRNIISSQKFEVKLPAIDHAWGRAVVVLSALEFDNLDKKTHGFMQKKKSLLLLGQALWRHHVQFTSVLGHCKSSSSAVLLTEKNDPPKAQLGMVELGGKRQMANE